MLRLPLLRKYPFEYQQMAIYEANMPANPTIISSEQDLIDVALRVLDTDHECDIPTLKFNGWPKVTVDIKGSRYHSSLPSALMQGFLSFQDELNRAYAIARYGSTNLQKLTNEDRIILQELVFTIEEGSTSSNGDGDNWLNRFPDYHHDSALQDYT